MQIPQINLEALTGPPQLGSIENQMIPQIPGLGGNDHSTRNRWLSLLVGGPAGLLGTMRTQGAFDPGPQGNGHPNQERLLSLLAEGPRGLIGTMLDQESQRMAPYWRRGVT